MFSTGREFLLGVLLAVISVVVETLVGITDILRAKGFQVNVRPYIDAATVADGDDLHVICSRIIPNVLPLSFLYMMFNVTTAILIEATLSLFGVLNIDMSREMMIHTAETVGHRFGYGRYCGRGFHWDWQSYSIAPHSTLWEEISMKLRVSGLERGERRMDALLRIEDSTYALGGQKRRSLCARWSGIRIFRSAVPVGSGRVSHLRSLHWSCWFPDVASLATLENTEANKRNNDC